jgi:hypothetical protein
MTFQKPLKFDYAAGTSQPLNLSAHLPRKRLSLPWKQPETTLTHADRLLRAFSSNIGPERLSRANDVHLSGLP